MTTTPSNTSQPQTAPPKPTFTNLRLPTLLTILLLAICPPLTQAATLNVPADYPTIQSAIDAATNGDIVEIANGTYTGPGNKNLDFNGKAITVSSASNDPNLCIIDCQNNGRGFYFHNYEGPESSIRGITVTNGYADEDSLGDDYGAAMHIRYSSPTVSNCIFAGNSATRSGGAIYGSSCNATVVNCIFTGNNAQYGAGAYLYTDGITRFINCTFSGNAATSRAGAVHSYGNPPILTNCALWDNSAANNPELYVSSGNTTTATYCCIKGGWDGTGNIDADPLFADPDGPDGIFGTLDDDLHLMAGSPCINAGLNAAVPANVTTDLDGDERIQHCLVDMGADETSILAPDCNSNNISDACDIAYGTSADCNTNYMPDECEIAAGSSPDCNHNGILDPCEIDTGDVSDCNQNRIPDKCEPGGERDCNSNGLPDLCDLLYYNSEDCNTNNIPDECEPTLTGIAYVDDDATDGMHNGTDWQNAYTSLSKALDYAECSGAITEIRVAQGTYWPSGTYYFYATFNLLNGVALRGGYRGLSANGDPNDRDIDAFVTTLSGDFNNQYGSHGQAAHVVTCGSSVNSATLEGFTVTGGNAYAPTGGPHNDGGGMYNYYGSPKVVDCTFKHNSALSSGAAVYNYRSSPAFVNCTFLENESRLAAAISNEEAQPTIINCRFLGNSADSAGAIYDDRSDSIVFNCVFSGNVAETAGAIACDEGNALIINSTFSNNSADVGSCVYASEGVTLTNCVIWDNGTPSLQIYSTQDAIVANHNCIQGGWPGDGNINANPRFQDADGPDEIPGTLDDDLHLLADSPCINVGDNTALIDDVLTDYEGDDRVQHCRVDIGADETPYTGLDCNGNSIPDACDITAGTSTDCDVNNVPDECQLDWNEDCNSNGTPDLCDIYADTSSDCNTNGIPDECETLPVSTIYVDDDAIYGLNDGSSWENAFLSLADALNHAGCVTEIRVAQGIYKPSQRTLLGEPRTETFQLLPHVALRGGYRGLATGGSPDDRDFTAFVTALSGDIGEENDDADNAYHVLIGNDIDSKTILDGFLITAGRADHPSTNKHRRGGGLSNINSSPTILNCTFHNNQASSQAGAIANYDQSSPFVDNCVFSDNEAYSGGAIQNNLHCSPVLSACNFYGNSSTYGGSIASYNNSVLRGKGCTFSTNSAQRSGGVIYHPTDTTLTLTNCEFNYNSSDYYGAAIYYSSDYSATISACTFSNNSAQYGGVIYVPSSSDATVSFTDCTFRANSAYSNGGAAHFSGGRLSLLNCAFHQNNARYGGAIDANSDEMSIVSSLFSHNTAILVGGAIDNIGSPTITGCTFIQNSASEGGALRNTGDSFPVLTNCILWGNTADESPQIADSDDGYTTATYCCIEEGWPGDGNLDVDPQLAFTHDFHLSTQSPCIDSGTNNPPDGMSSHDLDGNNRLLDGNEDSIATTDIGAHEFNPTAPALALSATDIAFIAAMHTGTPPTQTVSIRNAGGGTLNWEIRDTPSWLTVSPPAGTSSGETHELTLAVDIDGLAGGDYSAILSIEDHEAVNNPQQVRISLYLDKTSYVPQDYASIQQAIDAVRFSGEIVVAQGTYTECINLRGKPITLRSSDGADATIIDGNGDGTVITCDTGEGPDTMIVGFTITNGSAYDGAGMLCQNGSSPTVEHCTFTDNSATHNGGGIFNDGSSPSLLNCLFTENSARYGGGMYNCSSSKPTVTNCTFADNNADSNAGYGGGICSQSGSAPVVTDCDFFRNGARSGGGVSNYQAYNPLFVRCLFEENAAEYGGGMQSYASTHSLLDCTFTNNVATDYGGGFHCSGNSRPHLISCRIVSNSATGNSAIGGGIAATCNTISLTDCHIDGNHSDNDAGGIYLMYDTEALFTNCRIADNTASDFGGGLYCNTDGPVLFTNCTITGNTASDSGGGLYCISGRQVLFTNCLLANNTTEMKGGGIYCHLNDSTFTNCTIAGNLASIDGGGFYVYYSDASLTNCLLWNNTPDAIDYFRISPNLSFSNIQDGWPGFGNIDADPLFIDTNGPDDDPTTWHDNDYRLSPDSPCIDAGSNGIVPLDSADLDNDGNTSELTPLDLDGRPRFFDDPQTPDTGQPLLPTYPYIVDMGAYEYRAPILGDLNEDGHVDLQDYPPFADCLDGPFIGQPADFDQDGLIDTNDLAIWSPCITGPAQQSTPDCAIMDLDADGDVDLADYAILTTYNTQLPTECTMADFDHDGNIDLIDFANFQSTCGD